MRQGHSDPAIAVMHPLCQPNMSSGQVAFPYLYNNRPRKVRLSVYHHPMVMYIKAEDPDLPAFYYDPLIHPIASYKSERGAARVPELDDEDEDAFVLPEGVQPISSFPSIGLALIGLAMLCLQSCQDGPFVLLGRVSGPFQGVSGACARTASVCLCDMQGSLRFCCLRPRPIQRHLGCSCI